MSSRAAPAIMSRMGSATSSCTQSSRNAEQRWPAERNAEVTTSSVTCSGSAVASTIIGLMPPVSAISGTIGRILRRQRAVDGAGDLGRAGEGNAGDTAVGDERRADLAVARHEMRARSAERRPRAGAAPPRRRSAASARPASRPRHCRRPARRHLAQEDRQRKIPRADADEHAAAAIAQLVAFAGRPRQRLRRKRRGALRRA